MQYNLLSLPWLQVFINLIKITFKESLQLSFAEFSSAYGPVRAYKIHFMKPSWAFILRKVSFFPVPFPPSPGWQGPVYFSLSPRARSYLRILFYNASLLEKNDKTWSQIMLVQGSDDCFSIFIIFSLFSTMRELFFLVCLLELQFLV